MVFGRTFVKRFTLCYRTVVRPVCPRTVRDVGVLWPDGLGCHLIWMLASVQATLCSMGTQLSAPKKEGGTAHNFRPMSVVAMANGWMVQDATWYGGIGLGLGHIVLDGDSAPPKRGTAAPTFRPMSIVAKRLDGSRMPLGTEVGLSLAPPHCVRWGASSPPQRGTATHLQFSAHVYCGQTARWIKVPANRYGLRR